ncbi:MAG: ATP-binding protein [Chitinophagales bacterium]
MKKTLVGREEEKRILRKALESDEAEMVSIIGRRRVGKTFLIKTVYKDHLDFEITGLQNAPKTEQLQNFAYRLGEASNLSLPVKIPVNWLEAFMLLINYLKNIDSEKRKVVFLDEIPWLATHKSGFLRGLSFFWNSWAVDQNIVVVICGSAASWMIQKVIHHRGGLHNRVTKNIFLEPFTLLETELYLNSRNIYFERYQIIQIYMAIGGIPHYLKEIEGGKSATQNIEQICFSKKGLLQDEFLKLYPSLFSHAENHIAVIRALGQQKQGLTRQQIIEGAKISAGGTIQRVLKELVQSGFISDYQPFGKKKKEKLYRLTDEYSLFYLQFIEGKKHEGKDLWHHISQTQNYKTWSGYAFESICLKHIPQIKKALGISGIYAVSYSFYKKGTDEEKGTQIDLLIDRKDQTINLVEIKFYNEIFSLSKSYAEILSTKKSVFRATTKTRKQIFMVLITTFGLKHNKHSLGLIDSVLTMDDLFEPE